MSIEGVLQLLEATDWRLPFRARLVDSRIEEWRQLSPPVILALEQLLSSLPLFNEPERERVKAFFKNDDHYWIFNTYSLSIIESIVRGEIDLMSAKVKVETLIELEGGRFDERDTEMVKARLKRAIFLRSREISK